MTTITLNTRRQALILVTCMLMSGCANPGSMAKYMTVGAIAGAGVGAVTIIATGGCVGCGAAVGAAAGAGLGAAFNILDYKR